MSVLSAVDGQVVRALWACPGGLRRKDLFPLCDSAAEELDVSAALKRLKDDGYVEVVAERKGNVGAVYVLTGQGAEVMKSEAVAEYPTLSDKLVSASEVAGKKLSAAGFVVAGNGPECDLSQPWKDWGSELGGEDVAVAADIDVDHFDVIMKSLVEIKKQVNPPRRAVDDLEIKLQCLNRLAVMFNPDIAELLNAIADDLEAA
jgi:hypothetical protein